ncbi:MAG TPA: hypothetical protein VGF39_05415 [Stellaceae bacterium]|jgi:carbon-monoxide dehydrogenase large subunit
MIGTNRYIGSPVERVEDLRFQRGRGQFVGDLKRESMLHAAMLHAAILRSPVAHGLVAAVDASAALAIAGVRAPSSRRKKSGPCRTSRGVFCPWLARSASCPQ